MIAHVLSLLDRLVETPLEAAEKQLALLHERPEPRWVDVLRVLAIYGLVAIFGVAYLLLEAGIVHFAPALEFQHKIPGLIAVSLVATFFLQLRRRQQRTAEALAHWKDQNASDKIALRTLLERLGETIGRNDAARAKMSGALEALLSSTSQLQNGLDRVAAHVRVVDAGPANRAALNVMRRLKDAEVVRNTFIGYATYLPNVSHDVEMGIIEFVQRDKVQFREICSAGSGVERAERIRSGAKAGSYRPRVLRAGGHVPICNFIILDYPHALGMEAEVFFGWTNFTENEGEHVFGSSDPEVVGFFSDYFAALERESDPYQPNATNFAASAARAAEVVRRLELPQPSHVYAAVAERSATQIADFAREDIELSALQVREFSSERLREASASREIAEQARYFATHVVHSEERARLWREAFVAESWFTTYLDAQREILNAGGSVKRIFVFQFDWLQDHWEIAQHVLKQHHQTFAGTQKQIEVHVMAVERDSSLLKEDMTILNGRELFLWEVSSSPREFVRAGRYVTNEAKVRARLKDYEGLFRVSKTWPDFEAAWRDTREPPVVDHKPRTTLVVPKNAESRAEGLLKGTNEGEAS